MPKVSLAKDREQRHLDTARATIKAYLVAIRVTKCNYFSALIVSANSRPVALFQVIQSLGGSNAKVHLKGCCED